MGVPGSLTPTHRTDRVVTSARAAAAVLGMLVSNLLSTACDDGPTAPTAEQEALAAALARAGFLPATGGYGYADDGSGLGVLAQIVETGRLTLATPGGAAAEFDAVGLVVVNDFPNSYLCGFQSCSQDVDYWSNLVVAWTGFDAASRTVDQVSVTGAFGTGLGFLQYGSVVVDTISIWGGGAGFSWGVARWHNGDNSAWYRGIQGTYLISEAKFGGEKKCAPRDSYECRYATGTLTGTFNFTALETSGSATYTQSAIVFSVPAIRVTLSW